MRLDKGSPRYCSLKIALSRMCRVRSLHRSFFLGESTSCGNNPATSICTATTASHCTHSPVHGDVCRCHADSLPWSSATRRCAACSRKNQKHHVQTPFRNRFYDNSQWERAVAAGHMFYRREDAASLLRHRCTSRTRANSTAAAGDHAVVGGFGGGCAVLSLKLALSFPFALRSSNRK